MPAVGIHDPGRRNQSTNGTAEADSCAIRAVGRKVIAQLKLTRERNHVTAIRSHGSNDSLSCQGCDRNENDPTSVWRPARKSRAIVVGQTLQPRAIGVNHIHIRTSVALSVGEDDLLSVR